MREIRKIEKSYRVISNKIIGAYDVRKFETLL